MTKRKDEAVWVVEILNNGKWEPTVGVGLCRKDGHYQMKEWAFRNPDDYFRLTKYVRITPVRRKK